MRDVLLNLTTSLDGFIADRNGGIDWLMPPPDDVPTEYPELMDTVDTLIMERGTYEASLALEGGLAVFEDTSTCSLLQSRRWQCSGDILVTNPPMQNGWASTGQYQSGIPAGTNGIHPHPSPPNGIT